MKKLNQWIDRFAYSHPRFGIPNLMLYIVIANAVTYILTLFAGAAALSFLEFDLYHVLHGEVWRLVTFVLLPFTYRPISLFIMLSFCYFSMMALMISGRSLPAVTPCHGCSIF